jgi:hypothetical protein
MVETSVQTESSVKPTGGAAPAERQCSYIKANGEKCRDWAVRGQQLCGRHGLFVQTRMDKPIGVPLLEDEDSIVLVLSETVRGLAWGTLPVTNGRHIIAALRLAHTMQSQKMQMAKLRLQMRKMGVREEEILELAPVPAPAAAVSEESGDRSEEPGDGSAESAAQEEGCAADSAGTAQELIMPPHSRGKFRDLKKQWDKDLQKGANEMTDMVFKRYGETREEFVAARATPFGEVEAQERELARI